MLTLHVEGKSLEDIKAKVDAILGKDAIIERVTVALDAEAPVMAEKKKPGRPKMVVTKETLGPEKTESFVDEAKPVPAAPAPAPAPEKLPVTFENMKKQLQEVAKTAKDTDAGMVLALGIIKEVTGKEQKLKEIPESEWAKIMDKAAEFLAGKK